MKRYKIIGGITLVCVIAFGGWIYMEIYGNPFKKAQVKDRLYAYIDEELPDVQQDFTCGDVGFNPKNDTYYVTCISKTQPELAFYVEEWGDGTINDSYQFDGVEGLNAFGKFNQEITKMVVEKISDITIYKNMFIRVNTTLDKLDEQSRIAFIQNDNVLSLPIFSAIFSEKSDGQSEDTSYVKQRFLALREVIKATEYTPLDYEISFFDETNNGGYVIKGVTTELMDRDDFEDILAELALNPQKYQASLGVERLSFGSK